jgi:uncharacterized 2Fe-2S/4Fe-4S cluster protein (DUF4445 family)
MNKHEKEPETVKIVFEPDGNKVTIAPGSNIFDAANKAGNKIRFECGGVGKCGKCRVIIKDREAVTELTKYERKQLSSSEIQSGYRLACQAAAKENVVVFVPPESRVESRRIQTTGLEKRIKINPLIKKFHVKVPKPTLDDGRSDFERLIESLRSEYNLSLRDIKIELLRDLPNILRRADWDVTVTTWNGGRVIAVEGGDTSRSVYGSAIDIGTSKIVVQVVDLINGETRGVGSVENPQIIYGEDLMTRISHAITKDEGRKALQDLIITGINAALKTACDEAKIDADNIYEATVVGNTAMHHFLLGIEPRYVAASPFTPAVKMPVDVDAAALNLGLNRNGNVHVLPVIAGFVGADAVGDVLSSGISTSRDLSLLLDIGTNTELFVGNEEDIISCSCASGPAFEGGHIKHGMKAVTGAIEKISINPRSYEVEYETIDEAKPRGLCGSAVIDVIAEMFKVGLIDNRGRFNPSVRTKKLRKNENVDEFVLVSDEDSATGRDIVFTQKDITEVQLAKAAIYTGCYILMKRKEVKDTDLKHIMIAGAFGNYINPKNAKTIGLVPDVPIERIKFLGNTAIMGAKMALVSKEARLQANRISRNVRYLELSVDPDFRSEFASALYIPHRVSSRFTS